MTSSVKPKWNIDKIFFSNSGASDNQSEANYVPEAPDLYFFVTQAFHQKGMSQSQTVKSRCLPSNKDVFKGCDVQPSNVTEYRHNNTGFRPPVKAASDERTTGGTAFGIGYSSRNAVKGTPPESSMYNIDSGSPSLNVTRSDISRERLDNVEYRNQKRPTSSISGNNPFSASHQPTKRKHLFRSPIGEPGSFPQYNKASRNTQDGISFNQNASLSKSELSSDVNAGLKQVDSVPNKGNNKHLKEDMQGREKQIQRVKPVPQQPALNHPDDFQPNKHTKTSSVPVSISTKHNSEGKLQPNRFSNGSRDVMTGEMIGPSQCHKGNGNSGLEKALSVTFSQQQTFCSQSQHAGYEPFSERNSSHPTSQPAKKTLVSPALRSDSQHKASSIDRTPCVPTGPEQLKVKLRSVTKVPEKFRKLFDFPYFNAVQSRVLDDVLFSDKSVVVCAPTGSGKTVALELAIVRMLSLLDNAPLTDKIVYMAPIKALCSERFEDWSRKFGGELGMRIKELTGDTLVDEYYDIQGANLILTTPEKWDSMTRRWQDDGSLVRSVRLFLIDEVHQLNEAIRGATMEVVVSRMKTVARQKTAQQQQQQQQTDAGIRFLAVSATVPNAEDIAEWLSTPERPAVAHKLDEALRPVRLRKVVLGFTCADKTSEFRFDLTLSYKLQAVLDTYAEGKPALVFCATRKSVQQGAAILARQQRRLVAQTGILRAQADRLRDVKLRELVLSGVAYHHAGLELGDRRIIETLFTEASLPVLLATSTLAMGVNLPAHLVVIKSTMFYNMGAYQEYSEAQIFQMMGRAGRPQFDSTATAVIMTRAQTKNKYDNLVHGTQPVESSLLGSLTEHVNAEIVLGTVRDRSVALDWLRSTFLYIRVMRNPRHYGLKTGMARVQVEQHLQDLCLKSVDLLSELNLVSLDAQRFTLTPTASGRLMARYCVAYETMKNLSHISGTETIHELLNIVCKSQEFSDVQLRNNEKGALNTLNKDKHMPTIRFQITGRMRTADHKVSCLVQAVLGSLTVQDFSLQQDAAKIFRAGVRVTKCLVEMLWQRPEFTSLLHSVLLAKCFRVRLWDNSKHVARQLTGIGPALSTALVHAGLLTFRHLEERNPRDLELIVNRHPPFGSQLRDQVERLPKYQLTVTQANRYSSDLAELQLSVTMENAALLKERATSEKAHTCVLLLGAADNSILYKTRISDALLLREGTWSGHVRVRRCHHGDQISANLISQDWVGLDIQNSFTPFYTAPTPKYVTATHSDVINAPSTPCPGRAPCLHNCGDKSSCGHDCCKQGRTKRLNRTQRTMNDLRSMYTEAAQGYQGAAGPLSRFTRTPVRKLPVATVTSATVRPERLVDKRNPVEQDWDNDSLPDLTDDVIRSCNFGEINAQHSELDSCSQEIEYCGEENFGYHGYMQNNCHVTSRSNSTGCSKQNLDHGDRQNHDCHRYSTSSSADIGRNKRFNGAFSYDTSRQNPHRPSAPFGYHDSRKGTSSTYVHCNYDANREQYFSEGNTPSSRYYKDDDPSSHGEFGDAFNELWPQGDDCSIIEDFGASDEENKLSDFFSCHSKANPESRNSSENIKGNSNMNSQWMDDSFTDCNLDSDSVKATLEGGCSILDAELDDEALYNYYADMCDQFDTSYNLEDSQSDKGGRTGSKREDAQHYHRRNRLLNQPLTSKSQVERSMLNNRLNTTKASVTTNQQQTVRWGEGGNTYELNQALKHGKPNSDNRYKISTNEVVDSESIQMPETTSFELTCEDKNRFMDSSFMRSPYSREIKQPTQVSSDTNRLTAEKVLFNGRPHNANKEQQIAITESTGSHKRPMAYEDRHRSQVVKKKIRQGMTSECRRNDHGTDSFSVRTIQPGDFIDQQPSSPNQQKAPRLKKDITLTSTTMASEEDTVCQDRGYKQHVDMLQNQESIFKGTDIVQITIANSLQRGRIVYPDPDEKIACQISKPNDVHLAVKSYRPTVTQANLINDQSSQQLSPTLPVVIDRSNRVPSTDSSDYVSGAACSMNCRQGLDQPNDTHTTLSCKIESTSAVGGKISRKFSDVFFSGKGENEDEEDELQAIFLNPTAHEL